MSKKLFICEKREAAEELIFSSKYFGSNFKKGVAHYENDNFIFVWAAGHLYRQKEPNEINETYGLAFKVNPDFDYTMPNLVKEAVYIPDTKPKKGNNANKSLYEFKDKLIKNMQQFFKRRDIDEIICCADADDEGERIHSDPIKYNWSLIAKGTPITRFWNTGSYKSFDAVKKAFEDRKPLTDPKYMNRLSSAKARSMSDYIVGMKLTKLLTDKTNGFFRCGRVLSVMIGMIGRREDEIKNFVPKDYWNVRAKLNIDADNYIQFNHYYDDIDVDEDGKEVKVHSTRYFIETEMQRVLDETKAANYTGTIANYNSRTTSSKKPKLYSTDDFNAEFMGLYNVDLAYSNACLEWLRDEKYTSYPRTNGNFFSTDDFSVANSSIMIARDYFIDKLSELAKTDKRFADLADSNKTDFLKQDNGIFDNKKAAKQNHMPLSINGMVTSADLDKFASNPIHKERKDSNGKPLALKHLKEAYELIATRCLLQILPDDEVFKENLTLNIAGHMFETNTEKTSYLGWKQFDTNSTIKKDKSLIDISGKAFKTGDTITVNEVFSVAEKTTCPKPYNLKTMLQALMKVNDALTEEYNSIQDPVLKKEKMKQFKQIKQVLTSNNGVGTGATRETILDKPKTDGLIVFTGKNNVIELTDLGRYQYELTPNYLKSLETTALWEQRLDDIRNGLFTYDSFIEMVEDSIKNIVGETLNNNNIKVQVRSAGSGKPTTKQVNLVKMMAQRLNIKLDKATLATSQSCSQFIEEHKDKVFNATERTLSDKQIDFIKKRGSPEIIKLAEKGTVTVEEYKQIQAFFDNLKSNETIKLSEKQVAYIMKNGNDELKALANKGTLTQDEFKKIQEAFGKGKTSGSNSSPLSEKQLSVLNNPKNIAFINNEVRAALNSKERTAEQNALLHKTLDEIFAQFTKK